MKKRLRMLDWLLVALVLSGVVAVLAPHQLPVTAYKLSLIAAAAVVGYWLDRSLFPYGRPDSFGRFEKSALLVNQVEALLFGVCMLRRAIIIAACILGVSLGA